MDQVYKRNDFIVKLFACLFIAIFLVFSFIGSRVFASSTSITPVNTDYNIELNENISQYFYIITCCYIPNENISLVRVHIFEQPITLRVVGDEYRVNEMGVSMYAINSSSNGKQNSSWFNDNLNVNFTFDYSTNNLYNFSYTKYKDYIFSNFDVKDSSGNVVFQAPPQEKEKVLAPIVEGEEMKPLQEILQILPIVMIVIIGYLALRKGLAILFRFLRTS